MSIDERSTATETIESVDAAVTSESFDVDVDDIIQLTFSETNVKYPNEDYDPTVELEYDEYEDENGKTIKEIINQEEYDLAHTQYLDIVSYDYVWHADPSHKDEYYTEGLDGTTEYTWDELDKNYDYYGYITHDARYIEVHWEAS